MPGGRAGQRGYRMLNFHVRAYAGEELIGEGSHQRCLIMNDRFMEKTLAKLK